MSDLTKTQIVQQKHNIIIMGKVKQGTEELKAKQLATIYFCFCWQQMGMWVGKKVMMMNLKENQNFEPEIEIARVHIQSW